MAGMSPVTMIKEPEAAALYTMHSLEVALRVGDAFVLCDAGGGTVDLITYEVVKLEPVLELRELVPGTGRSSSLVGHIQTAFSASNILKLGTGSMAGSLGLNQRFGEAVKSLVGEDKFFELRKTEGYRAALESFDQDVKRRFKGGLQEEYLISFPMASLEDDEEGGLQANCWRIKGYVTKVRSDPQADVQSYSLAKYLRMYSLTLASTIGMSCCQSSSLLSHIFCGSSMTK